MYSNLKVRCQENCKSVNFCCSDNEAKGIILLKSVIKKLMSIQKLCQLI